MLNLSYRIFSKKSGEEVARDVLNFDSLSYFFFYMKVRYGYDTKNFDFVYSGMEV